MSSKIKIISAFDENMRGLSDLSFSSVEKFCKKQGVDCERFLIENFERPAPWFKILLLINQLKDNNYDYIMWIDADACINNLDFDITNILQDHKSFYISRDFNNFNSGVFIVKNTPFITDLLHKIYSMSQYINHIWWEQAAFIDLYEQNYMSLQEEVCLVKQKILNAYDYRHYGYNANQEGNFDKESFVVHYPSLPYNVRFQEIKNIIEKQIC
jgi:hypothetical protein